MNAKEFERKLAWRTGWSDSEIDQRIRPLRSAGLVERAAGRHAPDISPAHAAHMMLQLVARRATDAHPVAQRARDLRGVCPPKAPRWLKARLREADLLGLLAASLSPADDITLRRLTIDSKGTFATADIARGSERVTVFFTDLPNSQTEWVEAFPDRYHALAGSECGTAFVLGETALQDFAEMILPRPDGVT